MSLRIGEEFASHSGSAEWWRKRRYLDEIGSDAVLTNGAGDRADTASSGRRVASTSAMDLLQMLEQQRQREEQIQQINENFDAMDRASVEALQQIEEELLALRLEREQMLERAFRDERGRAIFMTEDESAAYYEDGTQLGDDEFRALRERLRGKPTWEQLQAQIKKENDLLAERGAIHTLQDERDQVREDLATGAISPAQAQIREQEIEAALPERVKRSYGSLQGKQAEDPLAAAVPRGEGEPLTPKAPDPSPDDAPVVRQPVLDWKPF